MKRLFSKSNKYLQMMGWCVLASTLMQCQNCQDIKSNDSSAFIKVVFFLNNTRTVPDTVQVTSRGPAAALTSGGANDALEASSLVFALPSNSLRQTYTIQGTFIDAANQTQPFSRTITVDFNRKISIIRPDCGVSEDITITKVSDADDSKVVSLSGTNIDTTQTEGNVKIFLQ